jgi:hypothetical protein
MMIVTQPVVIDLVREGEDFTDAIQALDLLFATFAVRVHRALAQFRTLARSSEDKGGRQ